MSDHFSSSPDTQDSPRQRRWLRNTLRIGTGLGIAVVGATVVLDWVVERYVKQQVIPQAQAQLETVFDRPVTIGNPHVIVPWAVRLGPSEVERLASVNSIGIGADLGYMLMQRRLGIDAQITGPQLSLDTPLGSNLNFNLGSSAGGGSLPLEQLNLKIVDGEVVVSTAEGSRPLLQGIQARAQVKLPAAENASTSTSSSQFQIEGRFQDSPFRIDGSADLETRQGSAQLTAQQLPLDPVPTLLPEDSPITILGGDVDLNVQFDFAGGGPLQFEGEVDLSSVSVGVEGLPFPLTGIQGTVLAQDQGQRLQVENLDAQYGEIPIRVTGSLGLGEGENSGLDLQVSIPRVTVDQLQRGFDLNLPVAAEGEFQADLQVTGSLSNPQVSGDIRSLTSGRIDNVSLSDLVAQFTYRDQQVQVEPIRALVGGGMVQGSAQVQLGDAISAQAQLDLSDLDLDQVASTYDAELPYRLGKLDAQMQIDAPQLEPILNAQWQISGGELQGQGQVDFAEGTLILPEAQLLIGEDQGQVNVNGQWASGLTEASLTANAVDLSFFRPDVQGTASAQFSIRGEAETIDLAGLTAEGSVALPEGIQTQVGAQAIDVPGPIRSQLAWTGSALRLEPLQLGEVGQIQGQVAIDPQTFQVGALDLSAAIAGLDLTTLPLPAELGLAGTANLNAQVQGSLQAPEVSGDAALSGFQVAGLMFANLQGPLRWQPDQGGGLDLQAAQPQVQDQISAELSFDARQINLTIRQAQTELMGNRDGEQAQVTIVQFPLQAIGALAGGEEANVLSGDLSAELALDVAAQTAEGQIAIETLRIAQIEAREVGVDFSYSDGVLGITEAELQLFESLYQASGTVTLPMVASTLAQPDPESPPLQSVQTGASNLDSTETLPPEEIPQLDLQISTSNSRLQDIVSTFKWQTWEDVTRRGLSLPPLGPAEVLEPTDGQGQTQASLLEQLRNYLRVLRQQFEADANQEESPLPPPTSIQGEFTTQARISGPLTQPVVDLDFQGQNWVAEEFQIQSVLLEGRYADRLLTLQPATLSYEDRRATFEGQLGLETQSGTLQVVDLPLGTFQRFLPDSFNLNGDFNTQLQLAGNLRDPQISGDFAVNNTQLNEVPIQEASGQVSYDAGIWDLDSRILVAEESQPVVIDGTVPFTLPVAEVQADTQQLDLNLRVEDQALQLINAFTDQVTWQSGESQVNVTIRGTFQDPFIQGDLIVSDGALEVAVLANPITDLNGRVDFNMSLLEVPELTAQVGSGTVTAMGQLPISSRGAFSQRGDFQPLTVQLNQVDLNIPGRYQGKVDGNLVVGGILTRPLLEGQISVSQGNLELSPSEAGTAATPIAQSTEATPSRFQIEGVEDFQDPLLDPPLSPPSKDSEETEPLIPLRFGGLDLVVGNNITVGWENFFSFQAMGELLIGGSLRDLQPDGTISLVQGGIDLPIGSGFRLDRSERNTAVFDPQNGLDPFLNLQLITRVTEVTTPPERTIVVSQDDDSDLVSSQTVEIRAVVQGRASELRATDTRSRILSLSSLPPREEGEILTLLVTTTVASLGTGVGLLQGNQGVLTTLGDAVGLDDVRIGPTFQVDTEAANVRNVGLEAELVKDLGLNFSVSGRVPLSEPQPTRYSARYRVNPQTLLRYSTDLEGNESAAVDLEIRF